MARPKHMTGRPAPVTEYTVGENGTKLVKITNVEDAVTARVLELKWQRTIERIDTSVTQIKQMAETQIQTLLVAKHGEGMDLQAQLHEIAKKYGIDITNEALSIQYDETKDCFHVAKKSEGSEEPAAVVEPPLPFTDDVMEDDEDGDQEPEGTTE